MSVFFTGYRGSGKTTVGKLLAKRLNWPFIDCDQLIVERAGKTIREIFAEQGEPAFRDLESQIVSEMAQLDNHVIALGGGALVREQNRQAIRSGGHKIVFLRCHEEELHRRIHQDATTGDSRPALTNLGGGIDEIRKVLAVREPIYQAAMHVQIDVTHLTPEQVAEEVVKLI